MTEKRLRFKAEGSHEMGWVGWRAESGEQRGVRRMRGGEERGGQRGEDARGWVGETHGESRHTVGGRLVLCRSSSRKWVSNRQELQLPPTWSTYGL